MYYSPTLCLRELEKKQSCLDRVRLASDKPVTILPNSDVVVNGITNRELPYPNVCALLQSTIKSTIPEELEISPSLIVYQYGHANPV